jgi:hypothetical protein
VAAFCEVEREPAGSRGRQTAAAKERLGEVTEHPEAVPNPLKCCLMLRKGHES